MKKMKVIMAFAMATLTALSMNTLAFAGQWKENDTGWWYDNGNGTWPASSWQWIDGNGDGVAECYYFNKDGYCLMNGVAPDGSSVNANGAWTVNGVVQTKNVGGQAASMEETKPARDPLMLYDQQPVITKNIKKWESASTNKEHENWVKVLKSDSLLSGAAYIEFYAGGEYDSLKATVAPSDYTTSFSADTSWEKDDLVSFQILGDDDEVLYETSIDYRTSAFDIDVDITGQDSVTIYLSKIESEISPVILKNARFE